MTLELVKVEHEPQLINFDRAREALTLAHSVDEVKQIRDQAEAIRAYIKQQKGSFEMQNQAAEIKLRAERRAGEMLKETEKAKGGEQYHSQPTTGCIMPPVPSYASLGIEKTQAMRWQLEAEIPEEKFEQFIQETKEAAEELTSVAAVRIAQKIKRESSASEPVPLPEGIFDVIYADPPWKYDFSETTSREIENQYPTMELEEIKNIKVPTADNAVILLWATAPKLREALEVMEAWGFEYKTNAVWDKQIIGMGYWFRGQHELLLVGTKGKYSPPLSENRVSSVIREERTEHSVKPEIVYSLIERMFPAGKYLELFARIKRQGWSVWGNQC